MLKFGDGNAKLQANPHRVWIFDLPAGHSCPGASACQAFADRFTGAITDGPKAKFRCYAASLEVAFKTVREKRWDNYDAMLKAKTRDGMKNLILRDMPPHASYVRVHSSGDFFNLDYFDAWMDVARERPNVQFYAYTKSMHFVHKRKAEIPSNFKLLWSEGGNFDKYGPASELPKVSVVLHPEVAAQLGLEIDHDDTHAQAGDHDFALLIHGVQRKSTEAAEAIKVLKAEGQNYSYSR